jgi:hypothetical protein
MGFIALKTVFHLDKTVLFSLLINGIPCHRFADVSSHLLKIKPTLGVALGEKYFK